MVNRFTSTAGHAASRLSPKGYNFRCVYCKKRFASRNEIPSHEATCPMRLTMKRLWQSEIDRAKWREEKRRIREAATSAPTVREE